MQVCFNGFGEDVVTFEADETVEAGAPVMVSGNGKVSAAEGVFCGVCVGVRGGYAAVQLKGYVTLPYGTAPETVGYQKLAVDETGKVSAAGEEDEGREYLVLDVDEAAGSLGLLL